MENLQKFMKKDMKAGYVVKFNNGEFAVAWPYEEGMELITTHNHTYSLNKYDDRLLFNGIPGSPLTIQTVFGLKVNGDRVYEISANNRNVLFRREAKKRLSKEDIEKLLGFEIEIVEESQMKSLDDLAFDRAQEAIYHAHAKN